VTALTYARYDLLKTFRNRRFLIFTLGFPLLLYVFIASANEHVTVAGIPFPVYYMTGMVAFGTMNAVTSGGGMISLERNVGWTRQLRVTPLPVWAYMATKVARGYLMSSLTIIVLYIAGMALNVSLSVGGWLLMTALVLVGLAPFAALGVLYGHALSADTMGPALGGTSSLFAFVGGAWFPLSSTGVLHDISQLTPSYWLVWAGHAGVTHQAWPLKGWLVVLVWTVVLARLALLAYKRDLGKSV
jgi:ABC-2 type transport system permease protein